MRNVEYFCLVCILFCTNCALQNNQRNQSESFIVLNTGYQIETKNIVFVVELKNSQKKIKFHEAQKLNENLPLSDEKISQGIMTYVKGINKTINETKKCSDRIKIALISKEMGWVDKNIMIWIPYKSGYVIINSFGELKKLVFSINHLNIRPNDIEDVGRIIMDNIYDNIDLRETINKYCEKQAISKALIVLENEIRRMDIKETGPLLKNNFSPKINNALKVTSFLLNLKNSKDSSVIWATNYLKTRNIIKFK